MTPALALLLACAGNKTVESTPAPAPTEPEVLVPAAADPAPPPSSEPTMRTIQTDSRAAVSDAYAARVTPFATRFHSALADGNSVTSGISASFALGMLAEGAADPTAFETLWGDGLDAVQSDHARALAAYNDTAGVELTVVNGLWTGEGLTIPEPVSDRLASVFAASPEPLPFSADPQAAADAIDTWTATNTGGLIDSLFTPADLAGMRLVLANAVAFKGRWKIPFDVERTEDQSFRTPDGPRQVPTMTADRMLVPYTEGLGYKAVMLSYDGDQAAMALILPDEGRSLDDAMDGLAADNLAALAVSPPRYVDVGLPRFRVVSDHDLMANSGPLGLDPVFATAFTRFGGGLSVSKAIQKVVVEVSEEGTEAAAVTGIMMKSSLPPRSLDFAVDRPFLFAIWHAETRTPLFIGQVVDPR